MVAKSIGVCGADVVNRRAATTKFNVKPPHRSGFLKSNLVGRVAFRLTSVMTP